MGEKTTDLTTLSAEVLAAKENLEKAESEERNARHSTSLMRERFDKATQSFDAAVDALRKENAVQDTDWGRKARDRR